MKVYNGSSWDEKQRVFLGEAVTGASSVTSVITYALQGRYDSDWFSVSANTNYTKDHNIGIYIPDGLNVQFYFSPNGDNADASYAGDHVNSGGNVYNHYNRENVANITRNKIKLGFLTYTQTYRSTAYTNGYYRITINRMW